ncbi:nitric oxide reductase activation protein NorD [Magnetospira sp. QH-2]|uniref:nitric oxide reductase activation protein NorD n=1 Tax=Magnetospira sp. (strain QH-2) TaxID=1288970 RepID=UPI0003E81BE4|nr:VWA domain-containing protein [Magnetospira sp. QH-2]CCQ74998.1 Rubisco activation protein CbbO [Magnetospira sp. QH-2]
MTLSAAELEDLRGQLKCGFEQLDTAFAGIMEDATNRLSRDGVKDLLDGGSLICMIGRGYEPVHVYLEEMPVIAQRLGEPVIELVSQSVWKMSRTPNGKSILPFLQTLGEASRRLGSPESFSRYITMLFEFMDATTGSIHGHHATFPSPGLPEMLNHMPYLLNQLSLEGMKNWIDYGERHYMDHPERQKDYFSLQSADSKAMLQKERHGTLFADVERKMSLYMRSLWTEKVHFIPYSLGFDELRKPMPYFDDLGLRVPDVYDDLDGGREAGGVKGTDRFRVLLAHMAAHRRWTQAIFADNFSPFQRVAVETFEDCRVEALAMREYPGLRTLLLKLHPHPKEDACDPEVESCIRHRLAMFSYAVLNAAHGYKNPDLLEYVDKFHGLLADGESSTQDTSLLAVSFIARTRRQQDQSPKMYFADTEVDYRDDNRHMWKYHELSDDEEMFDERDSSAPEEQEEDKGLPPRHYPEWDYHSKTYRPDWVSLYESLHPPGDADRIEALLGKHAQLAKRMKQMLDLLKPQQYVRQRYQEEGSELDLDVAIRSLIDFRAGATPDPRINMNHRTDGRNIAVSLLLDLSQSVGDIPEGCSQTVLELSQEAVSLLGWAIDRLGDEFAIAGFSSNTRHEVRFQHIKGYSEGWNDAVKGRLGAIEAGYSTRMGAALRHAGERLAHRQAEKKLLLVLTDGEPSDIDVDDGQHLTKDSYKAVQELSQKGIYTYCINLDRAADAYVKDIFGSQYTVIDNVERLPEKLPQLFMALTK